MSHARLAVIVVVTTALGACSPDLPAPPAGPGESADLTVLPEPPADLRELPAVVRFLLSGAGVSELDASQVHLARGSLTRDNLEDLAAGLPSEALSDRLVPVTVTGSQEQMLVIPHVPLELGQRYSLAVGAEATFELRVSAEPLDLLTRVFPMGEGPAHAVVCGAADLPDVRERVALQPGGAPGTMLTGTPLGRARSCARFEPDGVTSAETLHLPPMFAGRALDPAPLLVAPLSAPLDAACTAGELRLGPGCARIEDDRATVRGPQAPTLWVVAAEGTEIVRTTRDGGSFVVTGLAPSSPARLEAESLSVDGLWRADAIDVFTAPPRPRPVLNEVYADALGPEPEQEWVELLNDGTAPLELAGLVLQDAGGESVVPEGAGTLAPGALALLVSTGFDASGSYDLPPAPGTRIVTLEELGGNGLSNQGEMLRLLSAGGELFSTFPGAPKPRPGISVARTRPSAEGDEPEAFVLAEPPTPGAPFSEPTDDQL